MITSLLIFKLTLVLASAALGLSLCRALEARVRTWLCTTSVALALLLPVLGAIGATVPIPLPGVFTFAVHSASGSVATSRSPWHTIWLVGVLIVALRYLAGLFYLALRTRKATPWQVGDALMRLQLIEANASVRLAQVPAPLVWGWFKPIILLPEESRAWPPEDVRLALLHELAHVRRLDLWMALLWMCAKAVYWFHPLVWWIAARAREDQELACDARVLAAGASPAQYAGLLVGIARHVQSPAAFGCAMVTHPNLLRGRVMHILQSRPPASSTKSLASLFIAFALMASAGFVALADSHYTTSPPSANDQHVYKIGGDASTPKLVLKVEPKYSAFAKEKKIMGSVLLQLVIDQSGLPRNIQVKRGLEQSLDANAIAAVEQWRFTPAQKAGKAVACEANIEVNFRLK